MRQYSLSFSELIDRLSVAMMKEVKIPEHREEYVKEKNLILHDIDEIIKEKSIKINKELLHAIIVLVQANSNIWYNLAARTKDTKDLEEFKLTTKLNGIRNEAKNRIQELIGESQKKEYKRDCPEAEEDLTISWI